MGRHELQSALPLGRIEVGIAKPRIAIAASTAPFAFRHVVV
jgi:hypothetical protein